MSGQPVLIDSQSPTAGQPPQNSALTDTTIYLSPSGNDTNTGLTVGSRIKTIEKYQELKPVGQRRSLTADFAPGAYTIPDISTLTGGGQNGRNSTPEFWKGAIADQIGTRTGTAGTAAGVLIDSTLGAAQFRTGSVASVASVVGAGQTRYVSYTGMAGLVAADAGPITATILVDPGTTSPLPALQISLTSGFAANGGNVFVGTAAGGVEVMSYQSLGTYLGNPALINVTRGVNGTTVAAHAVGEIVSVGAGKKFLFTLANNVSSANQGSTSVTFSVPDSAGTQLISGMTAGSFAATSLGMFVRVRGAASAVNNGELQQITAFVSATSVRVFNPLGVAEGPTAGVSWAERALPSSATGNNGSRTCVCVNAAGTAGVFLSPQGIVESTGLISWQDSYKGDFARLVTPTTITTAAKAGILNNQRVQIANGTDGNSFSNALNNTVSQVAIVNEPSYKAEYKIDGTFVATPGYRTVDISASVTATDVAVVTVADIVAAAVSIGAVNVGAVITLTASMGNGFINGVATTATGFVISNTSVQQAILVESHGTAATATITNTPVASIVDNERFFVPDGVGPGANIGFNASGGAFAPTFTGDVLTGSLTFTTASAAVTGVGTFFTREILVGDWIYLDADGTGAARKVLSITSDTVLTLSAVYAAAGGSGASHVQRVIDISALADTSAAGVGVQIMGKINAISKTVLRVFANTNNVDLATTTQTAVVNLENAIAGSAGNVAIVVTLNGGNAAFVSSGFAGGVGAPTTTFTLEAIFNAAGYGAVGTGSQFVIEKPATYLLVGVQGISFGNVVFSGIKVIATGASLLIIASYGNFSYDRCEFAGNGVMTLTTTFYTTFGAQGFLSMLNSPTYPFPAGGSCTSRMHMHNLTWNHQFFAHYQGGQVISDQCTINVQVRAQIASTIAGEQTTVNFLQSGQCGQATVLRLNGTFSPADAALVQFGSGSKGNFATGTLKNGNGYGVLILDCPEVRLGAIVGNGHAKAGIKVDRCRTSIDLNAANTTTITGNAGDFEYDRQTPIPNWRAYAAVRATDANNVKGLQDTYLNRVDA